jgi:hypothetical protein
MSDLDTTPTTPTVRIIRVRFLEDEVYDGGIPQASYDNATVEDFECDAPDVIDEAVRALERAGVTFAATGTTWAADPDGSYVSDYGTAERTETTGHLYGFTARQCAAIVGRVG